MRIETFIIYSKAVAGLLLLWALSFFIVGRWGRDCLVAFLSSALVVDTTISIKNLQSILTDRIEHHIQTYYLRCRAIASEKSATAMQKNANCLKSRFQQIIRPATACCPSLGVIASVCIITLFLTGIPKRFDRFLVVAIYPALFYYSVVFLTYFSVFVQLNGSFIDRKNAARDKGKTPLGSIGEAEIEAFEESTKK